MQRQQKEEERAAKEAQRLAEEKRVLEERERKLEADRKRREEEKRVKDEEKRLREEERLKKEDEKKRKLKEEKAREAEKERKRKEQLAKEKEAEEKKAEEAALLEAKKLERQAYLQQQLLEEQKRQQELRRQEQLAKEALAKAEEEEEQEEEEQGQLDYENEQEVSPSPSSIPSEAQQPEQTGSPPTTPPTVDPTLIQSLSGSGNSVPSGWSSFQSHDTQLHPQLHLAQHPPHLQHQLPHQQPQHAFQGMYRPSNHFGQIGDDLFARPGRPFMGNIGHQGQQHFPSHQHPLSNQLQQVSGISPGLAPIGYGQPAPSKQLLNIMGNAPSTHYDSSNSGSPLNSPSSLGAIGTPVGGPFGPISPIGHSRRTSTPHGSTTSESIKPIQRPIGRPKDPATSMSSSGASSFDGLSLGLSGLAIGSELEKRSRSPPLNLSGSLDLDGVVLGTDLGRSTGSGSKSPTLRGQRESSLFSNSFFGAGGVRSSHGESVWGDFYW